MKYKLRRELDVHHSVDRSRFDESKRIGNSDNFWMGSYLLRERGKDNHHRDLY